ncbi:unnamed protein product [Ceutorhynchus assimilis]|uniref:BOD1/SHG1 domain-containing protein n=1 Tax=Ceutorhynchus assimilis TaxID=467358 RepID=A0A9N9MAS2_9CUCU|nr:unnamed protein product [Ceutorhynchus assimilis]
MNMMPTYMMGQGNGPYLPVQRQGPGGFMQGNFPPMQGQNSYHAIPGPPNYPPPAGQGNFGHYMQGHGPGTFMPPQGPGHFLPGQGPIDQSRLTEEVISDIKSQGLYDQFRRECVSDADMKPAYRNLKLRVESNVMSFLDDITFSADLNKIQLRELLRKHITDSKILDSGVERIVEQLVVSKINTVLGAKVEEVVYKHLGIENPTPAKPEAKPQKEQDKSKDKNLLPKDLKAVSSDSSNGHPSRNRSEINKKSTEIEKSPELASTRKAGSPHDADATENTMSTKVDGIGSDVSGLDSQDDSNSSSTKRYFVASERNTKMEISEVKNMSGTDDANINAEKGGKEKNDNNSAKRKSDSKTSNDKHKGHLERKDDKDKCKSHRHRQSGKSENKNKSVEKHVRKHSENRESSKTDGKERDKNIDKADQKPKENRDKSDSKSEKIDKPKEKPDKERPHKEKEHLIKDKKLPDKDKESSVKGKERPDKIKSSKEKSEKQREKSTKDTLKFEKHGEKSTKDKKKCDKEKSDKEKLSQKEMHPKSKSIDKDAQDRAGSSSIKHKSLSSSGKKDTNDNKNSAKEKSSSGKNKESSHKNKHSSTCPHKQHYLDKSKDRSRSSSTSKNKEKKSGGDLKSSGKVKETDNSKSDKKEGKKVTDDHYSLKDKMYDRRSTDRDSNDDSSKNNNFREDFLKSQKVNKEREVINSGCTDSTSEKVKQGKNSETEDTSTDLSYIVEKVEQEPINLNIKETEIMTITDNGTDSSNLSAPEQEQYHVEAEITNVREDSTNTITDNETDTSNLSAPEQEQQYRVELEITTQEDSTTTITDTGTDTSNLCALEQEQQYRAQLEIANVPEDSNITITDTGTDTSNLSAPEQEIMPIPDNGSDSSDLSALVMEIMSITHNGTDWSCLSAIETEMMAITDNTTDLSNLSAPESGMMAITDNTTDLSNLSAPESGMMAFTDNTTALSNLSAPETGVMPITDNTADLSNLSAPLMEVMPITDNTADLSNLSAPEMEVMPIMDNGTDSSNLSAPEMEVMPITDNTTDLSNLSAPEIEVMPITDNTADLSNLSAPEMEVMPITDNETDSSNLSAPETEIMPITDTGTDSSYFSASEAETSHSKDPFEEDITAEPDFQGFSKAEIDRSDEMAKRKMSKLTLDADDDDVVYYFEKPIESEAKLRKLNENIMREEKFIEESKWRLKAQFDSGMKGKTVKQAGPSGSNSKYVQMTKTMEHQAATKIEIGKKRKISETDNNNGFNRKDKRGKCIDFKFTILNLNSKVAKECKRVRFSGDENQDDTNICDVTPCNGGNKNEKSTEPTILQKSIDLASIIGKRQLVVKIRREVIEAPANDRLTLDPNKKAGTNGFKKPNGIPVRSRNAKRKVIRSANQRYAKEDLFKPRLDLGSSTSSRRRNSGPS